MVRLAALQAYEDEGLVARARHMGRDMLAALLAMQARHAVIGDVRGDGMFAIVELVTDRATRAPLAAWGENSAPLRALVRAARERGVSFAVRSNLIVIAPPLVITEAEMATALSVLDSLLSEFAPALQGDGDGRH